MAKARLAATNVMSLPMTKRSEKVARETIRVTESATILTGEDAVPTLAIHAVPILAILAVPDHAVRIMGVEVTAPAVQVAVTEVPMTIITTEAATAAVILAIIGVEAKVARKVATKDHAIIIAMGTCFMPLLTIMNIFKNGRSSIR